MTATKVPSRAKIIKITKKIPFLMDVGIGHAAECVKPTYMYMYMSVKS